MSGEPQPPDDEQETAAAGDGKRKRKRQQGWIESVIIALLLALGIRHFLVQAYKIPSGSMIPSLLVGDQLIASKIAYGIRLPFMNDKLVEWGTPKHGEVVVFRFPENPDVDFIKRTIGVPGDRVRIEKGIIYVNDVPIPRRDIGPYTYTDVNGNPVSTEMYEEHFGTYTYHVLYSKSGFHPFWNMPERKLGPHELFVMGDNRDHSDDSRFWGTVNLRMLEGEPLFIHFSWDSRHHRIRWNRIGDTID